MQQVGSLGGASVNTGMIGAVLLMRQVDPRSATTVMSSYLCSSMGCIVKVENAGVD